ncbi:MAG: hypothetical protein ACK5P5_00345 [Pseudobdellovibrionaceae bacterium]|jgi:drug/metabolite transporter (DMT)-like permease
MRPLLAAILILFSAYTGWIVWEFGYTSVFEVSFREHPSTQVVIDLFVAGLILLLVMVADNRRHGRPFRKVLPFLILGIFTGSIGALLYFLIYPDLLIAKKNTGH